MAVEVYELRLQDAPGEIWYGVKVNGRDLQAGWADPDAARRRGEAYARELKSTRTKGDDVTASMRRGAIVAETPPDETETPEAPEETPAEPETAPEATPEENGDAEED